MLFTPIQTPFLITFWTVNYTISIVNFNYFLTAVKTNYTLYNRLNYVIKVNYFLGLFNYFLTAVSANYVFIQPAPGVLWGTKNFRLID
jgi:hypothetical protein